VLNHDVRAAGRIKVVTNLTDNVRWECWPPPARVLIAPRVPGARFVSLTVLDHHASISEHDGDADTPYFCGVTPVSVDVEGAVNRRILDGRAPAPSNSSRHRRTFPQGLSASLAQVVIFRRGVTAFPGPLGGFAVELTAFFRPRSKFALHILTKLCVNHWLHVPNLANEIAPGDTALDSFC